MNPRFSIPSLLITTGSNFLESFLDKIDTKDSIYLYWNKEMEGFGRTFPFDTGAIINPEVARRYQVKIPDSIKSNLKTVSKDGKGILQALSILDELVSIETLKLFTNLGYDEILDAIREQT